MNDWSDLLVKPAMAIALLSVVVQGIKAAVDLLSQARARRISTRQAQIAYATTLLGLADGLHLDEGTRAVLKTDLAHELLPGELPDALRRVLGD